MAMALRIGNLYTTCFYGFITCAIFLSYQELAFQLKESRNELAVLHGIIDRMETKIHIEQTTISKLDSLGQVTHQLVNSLSDKLQEKMQMRDQQWQIIAGEIDSIKGITLELQSKSYNPSSSVPVEDPLETKEEKKRI